jgi:hypothetical protein
MGKSSIVFAAIAVAAMLSGGAAAAQQDRAAHPVDGSQPARALSSCGIARAVTVSCQAQAAWGDPYPSIIILKRLAPECGAAWVQVIRTNGTAYPEQCTSYEQGKLAIGTATGDYYLAVGRRSLTGNFVSRLDASYSRTALTWGCNRSPVLVTDAARPSSPAKPR